MHRNQMGCLMAALVLLSTANAVAAESNNPVAAGQPTPDVYFKFENVKVFTSKKVKEPKGKEVKWTTGKVEGPFDVYVRGNTILKILPVGSKNAALPSAEPKVINGTGHTLMPGLIDMHTHLAYATLSQAELLSSDASYMHVVATRAASDMLMRGFTSVRDLGGPVFGLKRGIDKGVVVGPRIWPSGAFISQSGGHGDFRMPSDLPAGPGDFTYGERIGAAAIADSPDMVRKRAREQLALGASQLKLMAGGGVSSAYDPLDVTQYSAEEMRTAVEAAENWGTYITVHAYTNKAVNQAIEAGVKCIDHGQLLEDEEPFKAMAKKGVWLSLQAFFNDGDRTSPYPEGSDKHKKQMSLYEGTKRAYQLALKHRVKLAWGTDVLYDPEYAAKQGRMLSKLVTDQKLFTAAEALTMATAANSELLALSGERSPYKGPLGVVDEGALADLLLVKGDPVADIKLIEKPEENFLVIMKDGQIYKDITKSQLGVSSSSP
ncbi:MAG: amidohydrolase family protein [Cystobacter sp.]